MPSRSTTQRHRRQERRPGSRRRPGGTTGDGQTDAVTVKGTDENDAITAAGDSSTSRCRPSHAGRDPASGADRPALRRGRGGTTISATGLAAARSPSSSTARTATTTAGGRAQRAPRRQRERHDRRQRRRRPLLWAGDDTFVWDPGDGATRSTATTVGTRWCSAAPASRTRSTCRRTETGCGSSATPPTSRWTPAESSGVFNAIGGADSVTVNDLAGTDVTASTSTSPAPSWHDR